MLIKSTFNDKMLLFVASSSIEMTQKKDTTILADLTLWKSYANNSTSSLILGRVKIILYLLLGNARVNEYFYFFSDKFVFWLSFSNAKYMPFFYWQLNFI